MGDSYALRMTDIGNRGAATSRVLEVAEAVSPMEAVEAVTRELAAALGATAVSFLIADLSGRALARLAADDRDRRLDR